jgi:hypothetical protein
MSTPAESGDAAGKSTERRMSLGKYVKRMSSVFRREKSGKGSGISGTAPAEVHEEAATQEGKEQEAAPAA